MTEIMYDPFTKMSGTLKAIQARSPGRMVSIALYVPLVSSFATEVVKSLNDFEAVKKFIFSSKLVEKLSSWLLMTYTSSDNLFIAISLYELIFEMILIKPIMTAGITLRTMKAIISLNLIFNRMILIIRINFRFLIVQFEVL